MAEKPAAAAQRDSGVRERWGAERRERIAVYFLQVYATSHASTLRTPKPRSCGHRWRNRRKREDRTGDRRCKGERTLPGVGSFQRVVGFRQMVRSLGFVELVDFGGHEDPKSVV